MYRLDQGQKQPAHILLPCSPSEVVEDLRGHPGDSGVHCLDTGDLSQPAH